MYLLIGIAFAAGIITILSPCVLPVLPIVLTGATIDDKKYPFGVVTGFIISFTVFTLFLTTLVNLTGISANAIRYISIIVVALFGLVLLIPKLHTFFELTVSKLVAKSSTGNGAKSRTGFVSGIFVGISMGLIWTPCVGPILGSVIALALSGSVNGFAFVITLAYALGTAIPMFGIMYGGRALLKKVPWLLANLGHIQKVFGVLLLIVALGLLLNWDRSFQTFITAKFPSYGAGLTKIEENDVVQNALKQTFQDGNGNNASEVDTANFKDAPELAGTGAWLNSDPLTISGLRGKVILIDFWTYSCINCIRTLPYIQSLQEKYAAYGLVIIGVHTPEFEFEKSVPNLAKAIKDFGLTYPVVQDNDYKTWRAYSNHYWPAKYFIDANGKVRKFHKGEGDYKESEEFIRQLLIEAGADLTKEPTTNINISEVNYAKTPETYLGYDRLQNFASPEGIINDKNTKYSKPAILTLNQFAYSGEWTIAPTYALSTTNSSLSIKFAAKNVFLVMRPASPNTTTKAEVYLDGKLTDTINIDSDRLYQLVELAEPGEHLLEIKYPEGGTEVYAFTFG
ncbi:hypothetical protein COV81_03295 [Candidatus Peregrinibacteria bacterium CG11_big_fil_rev_8_21_14_0_20_41_10]|nr:MAG: hypothetical protein COV81_03295 [Candidatus Peregrinibacteria bacterium CG11_big_fil_rev_8_21_14_0_20_41_10]PIZ75782.1 MAG: hypothetical protein COY06_02570 [Candidatus Peregrinibacteria bacterium CG_4_10_14_0_2_um_filter_41_8]PJC38435.1 MAG: hypothetical protein CO045_00315 [Candidatus Peregrinibacteria bacterium CG_4_9_14_0_2_um_filter_41_14]